MKVLQLDLVQQSKMAMRITIHLLVGDQREQGISREARDGNPLHRSTAPGQEYSEESLKLVRLHSLTPLLEIDILPHIRAGHRPAPRLADSRDHCEHLFKREVAKDEPESVGEHLLPLSKRTQFSHCKNQSHSQISTK